MSSEEGWRRDLTIHLEGRAISLTTSDIEEASHRVECFGERVLKLRCEGLMGISQRLQIIGNGGDARVYPSSWRRQITGIG